MNKKINFDVLYIEEKSSALKKQDHDSKNRKLASAQIKVNLREAEKDKLKKIANHNISAFLEKC